LGAFGIFFTQSPSFLEYQRWLQQTTGHNNAHALFDVEHIPGDHQVRKLLDPIAPSCLDPVFLEIFEGLEPHHMLSSFRVLDGQLLLALDGTNYFTSRTIHCHNGLTRQLSNGHTLFYHGAITPVIVCPGRAQVIALPPEYIMPQDGHAKPDGERAAGKRWLATQAAQVAPHGVTLLGDALYSNHPFCALVLQHRFTFIFTCKPDSPPTLSERLALWQATGAMATYAGRHRNGRSMEVTRVR
jgi:hypothetical protein